MNKKIKEAFFDSKYFHGRLTHQEAYNLCKEEMTNTGKPYVQIWYLFENLQNGKLEGRIRRYRRHQISNINDWSLDENQGLIMWIPEYTNMDSFVERKNPHTLLELARVATLDNCNGYCCIASLIEKIYELRIPISQKEELKKLARGFLVILEEKTPNEFCIIHNNDSKDSDSDDSSSSESSSDSDSD